MRFIALDRLIDDKARAALQAREGIFGDSALRDPIVQAEYAEACREATPSFNELVDNVRETIRSDGCVIVSGAPLGAPNAFLAGLSATLGTLCEPYRAHWSKVIRHIRPNEAKRPLLGGRTVVLNEVLHTDGTDWPTPNNYTCLMCIRPDPEGHGRSRVLRLSDALDHLASLSLTREAAIELWEKPLRWRIADEIGGGSHSSPAFSASGVRWLEYALRDDDENMPHVRVIATALEQAAGVEERLLKAGDILIVDNHAVLHARSPLHDPNSGRLLLRTKVGAVQPPGSSFVMTRTTNTMTRLRLEQ